MDLSTTCSECGQRAALIEILAPGELPAGIDSWAPDDRDFFFKHTDPSIWRLRYAGPGGRGGSYGDPITEEEISLFADVFTEPFDIDRLPETKLYDRGGICPDCRAAYCYRHWNISPQEWGTCPRGHGHGIDFYYD